MSTNRVVDLTVIELRALIREVQALVTCDRCVRCCPKSPGKKPIPTPGWNSSRRSRNDCVRFCVSILRGSFLMKRLLTSDAGGVPVPCLKLLLRVILFLAIALYAVLPQFSAFSRMKAQSLFDAWCPDGSCFATGHYDGTVKTWDATTNQIVRTFPPPTKVYPFRRRR